MQDTDPYDQYCTVTTTSEKYGIGTNTLYMAARDGRIKHIRVGGRILLDRADAHRYAVLHNKLKNA